MVSREKRWIILAENGDHATLGRATDPPEDEIKRGGDGLVALGLGGWLAVTEGVYYSDGDISVVEVRMLGNQAVPFVVGVSRFRQQRELARL